MIDAFIETTDDSVLLTLINITLRDGDNRIYPNPLEEPLLYTKLKTWVQEGITAYKALGGDK